MVAKKVKGVWRGFGDEGNKIIDEFARDIKEKEKFQGDSPIELTEEVLRPLKRQMAEVLRKELSFRSLRMSVHRRLRKIVPPQSTANESDNYFAKAQKHLERAVQCMKKEAATLNRDFRQKIEAMKKEVASLKEENRQLKEDLRSLKKVQAAVEEFQRSAP